MSDAQKLIAEVLRAHTDEGRLFTLGDSDWHVVMCQCGKEFGPPHGIGDHAEHVAAEIDKALGGLGREVSKGTRMCSYPGSGGPCEGKDHGRWVSGWTPEIDEEDR